MQHSRFRCPICRAGVERNAPEFPFCSERCRRTDLGHWAAGDYRIASDPSPPPEHADDA